MSNPEQTIVAVGGRTQRELSEALPRLLTSPPDSGLVEAIVARPGHDLRTPLDKALLTPESGLEGDRWRTHCWLKTKDGKADLSVQIAIINSRVLQFLSGSRERWALAGDNLYLDLDLSEANLPPGQRLRLGDCELEITAQPHLACRKFSLRYGQDAAVFVNSREQRHLRLRGVYARVVRGGTLKVGDRATKI